METKIEVWLDTTSADHGWVVSEEHGEDYSKTLAVFPPTSDGKRRAESLAKARRGTAKYTISFAIGPNRTATSMADAIRKARAGLLATRIYRGAEYDHEDGGRALDLWRDKRNATREMGVPADAVVTWRAR